MTIAEMEMSSAVRRGIPRVVAALEEIAEIMRSASKWDGEPVEERYDVERLYDEREGSGWLLVSSHRTLKAARIARNDKALFERDRGVKCAFRIVRRRDDIVEEDKA